jgi:hypothetical protein
MPRLLPWRWSKTDSRADGCVASTCRQDDLRRQSTALHVGRLIESPTSADLNARAITQASGHEHLGRSFGEGRTTWLAKRGQVARRCTLPP